MPPPLLLTRPRSASERLAAELRDVAGQVVISPLLRIMPRGPLPRLPGGALFTSAHGVESFLALGGTGGGPAWAVGPRTAARVEAAGFELRGAASDAAALAELVPADAPSLLHLRGAMQRGDLVARLRRRGLEAVEAVVYKQRPEPLTAEALDLLRTRRFVAPLYSPATAALFAAACSVEARANVIAICLSSAVADTLPFPPRAIALRPDGSAMLAEIRAALGAIEG